MLVDTHAHINMMVKKNFDTLMSNQEISDAQLIVAAAQKSDVNKIINVGTSLNESKNCIRLAQQYDAIFAVVGIHPNDLTAEWKNDLSEIKNLVKNKNQNKIVGIGECGMDFHYPDYNIPRQKDAFKAQIEIALEHDLALVVHTRSAADETLRSIEEYAGQISRGIIHCFSEQADFAQQVIDWGFAIGIGGIITYPKNNYLRDIVKQVSLESIVLETDSPFLPIQQMRGKQQSPQYIKQIAEYIAELRNESLEHVSNVTTQRALTIFDLK
jgi:TatD DNase family protein